MVVVPLFVVNLFCAWFQCELKTTPPFIVTTNNNNKELLRAFTKFSGVGGGVTGRGGRKLDLNNVQGPIAYTNLGPVEGYEGRSANGKAIFSFTGVPYGEPPVGSLRFRTPVPRKSWKGIWRATTPSPFCIQANAITMGMFRGSEDCLYLDIHTSHVPDGSKREGLPVIVWIPAGANFYGRSRTYGPKYLLNEDVILVPINMRFGAFGFLSTFDEFAPGNCGLKDMALAVKWVYENIHAFGGDPNRIIVGGLSSGAYSAHALLFTKHEVRNYVAGVFSMSGNAMVNHGLDSYGRVKEASNIIAKSLKCPTAAQGRSREMVECLRRIDPFYLASQTTKIYRYLPPFTKMLSPTIEPDLPGAFITELPEVLYEKGEVNPIPLIMSRAQDEAGMVLQRMRFTMLPILQLNWYDWMPKLCRLGFRSAKGANVTFEEGQVNLVKLSSFYFNKTKPPNFIKKQEFVKFVDWVDDMMYNSGVWKSLELHHKVAPTYAYMNKHKTFLLNPVIEQTQKASTTTFGSGHAMDFLLFFNNTQMFPLLPPGSEYETASKNLLNMMVNFAKYGEPLYRTQQGTLLSLWKPLTDMRKPMVLEVGLVHNISMIRDPLPGSHRLKIWEQVRF